MFHFHQILSEPPPQARTARIDKGRQRQGMVPDFFING